MGFGLASEIMKAYEETNKVDFNEQKRFWDLNFEDSMSLTQNETVNAEEAKEISKNVFPVPNNHKREDISQTNVLKKLKTFMLIGLWLLCVMTEQRRRGNSGEGRRKEYLAGQTRKIIQNLVSDTGDLTLRIFKIPQNLLPI